MLRYNIKKPIWNKKAVGIAAHRIKVDTMMYVTISYKDTEGNLVYPHLYKMPTRKMREYETQDLASGIKLHIIPIKDFEVLPNDTPTET